MPPIQLPLGQVPWFLILYQLFPLETPAGRVPSEGYEVSE